MAFLTAAQISAVAVDLLSRQLSLPNTVLQIPAGEYAGPNGGTVSVMVPAALAGRTQTTPGTQITWDTISEASVDVTVSHLYSGVKVTDEDLTLNLMDFARQVTMNQIQAVATDAEEILAAAMNGLASEATFALTASDDDTLAMILQARQALSTANVPPADRFFAVSPDISTRLLSVDNFVRADAAGSDSALREAVVGRLFGFTFVESNALDAGTAVAYGRSAFAFASFTPRPVTGVPGVDTAVHQANGVALRQAIQWLPDFLSLGSVLQTFAGASVIDPNRVFKLTTAAA